LKRRSPTNIVPDLDKKSEATIASAVRSDAVKYLRRRGSEARASSDT